MPHVVTEAKVVGLHGELKFRPGNRRGGGRYGGYRAECSGLQRGKADERDGTPSPQPCCFSPLEFHRQLKRE